MNVIVRSAKMQKKSCVYPPQGPKKTENCTRQRLWELRHFCNSEEESLKIQRTGKSVW